MKKRGWSKSGLFFVLSFSLLLFASFIAKAEEAKYIYDDLGRLYRVVDEQGLRMGVFCGIKTLE